MGVCVCGCAGSVDVSVHACLCVFMYCVDVVCVSESVM